MLIEHFVQIAGISGQSPILGGYEASASSSMIIDDEPMVIADDVEEEPSITIEELELSVRAYNCLKRASINSMAELLKKSEHDLLIIKNFGKKSADEVIEKLHEHGLDLQPNPEMDEDGVLIGE